VTRQLSLPLVLIALVGCMPTENQVPEEAFIAPLADKPVLNNIDVSPPPPFELGLEVDDLKLGEYAGFHATGAAHGDNVVFLRGYGIGTDCPSGFAPLCTDILGPELLFPGSTQVADEDGDASVYASLPENNDLIGYRVHMQAVVYNDSEDPLVPAGPFKFSDVVTGTFSRGEECVDDGFEPNDELLAATNLGEGEWLGLTMCGEGTDWYKIDLRDGDTMDIRLDFDDDEGDIDIAVYEEDFAYVGGSFGVGDIEEIGLVALGDATAYVNVYMYSDDGFEQVGNEYDLTMTIDEGSSFDCTDDALEPNDTPSDALDITDMLSGGCATDTWSDLTACVDTTGLDVYAVTLENGESVEAQVLSDALEGAIDLQILSSTTVVLDQDDVSDGDQYVSYLNTSGTAQTVYLRVDLELDLGAYLWGGTTYSMDVILGDDCVTDSDPRIGLDLTATALGSLLLPGDPVGIPLMDVSVSDTTDSGSGACASVVGDTPLSDSCFADMTGLVSYQLEEGAYYEMKAVGHGFAGVDGAACLPGWSDYPVDLDDDDIPDSPDYACFIDTYVPLTMPGFDVSAILPIADAGTFIHPVSGERTAGTLNTLFNALSIDFDEANGLIGALVYDFETGALLSGATVTPYLAASCSDPANPDALTCDAAAGPGDAWAWTSTPTLDTDFDGVPDSGTFLPQNTTFADGLIAFVNVAPGELVFDISTPDADGDGFDDYVCTPAWYVEGAVTPVHVYPSSLTGLQILCSRNDFGIGDALICPADDYEDNDTPSTAYDLTPWIDGDCSSSTLNDLYSCAEAPANLDVYRVTLQAGDTIEVDMTIDDTEGEADISLEYQTAAGDNYQMDADYGSGPDSYVNGYNDSPGPLDVYIRVEFTDDIGGLILGGTSYSLTVTTGPACYEDDFRVEHAFEVDDLASTLGGPDAWVPIPGLVTTLLEGGGDTDGDGHAAECSPAADPDLAPGVCFTAPGLTTVTYLLETESYNEIKVEASPELEAAGAYDPFNDYRPLYIPISTSFGDLDGWYYVMASEGLIDVLSESYDVVEPINPETLDSELALMHVRVFNNDLSGEGYPVYGPSPDGIRGVKLTPYMAASCTDPANPDTCTEVAAGFAGAYEASLGGFLPYHYCGSEHTDAIHCPAGTTGWVDVLGVPVSAPGIVVTSGDAIMAFALVETGEIVFDIDSDFDGDGTNDYECAMAHNPEVDTRVETYAGAMTSVSIRCTSCGWASPCPD